MGLRSRVLRRLTDSTPVELCAIIDIIMKNLLLMAALIACVGAIVLDGDGEWPWPDEVFSLDVIDLGCDCILSDMIFTMEDCIYEFSFDFYSDLIDQQLKIEKGHADKIEALEKCRSQGQEYH